MRDFEPLVTIFIPYYNDRDYLRDSIESVLNQTYKNIELILVDHASTDGSHELVHSYNDSRIKHITMEKNLGAGSGILAKEMLKIAKGEYVKLFCADDILMEDCIETLVNYVKEHPDKDVVFTDAAYINKKGKLLNEKHSEVRSFFKFNCSEKELLDSFFNGRSILLYPTNFMKTDILRKINISDTYIPLLDMVMWIDLLVMGAKFAIIEDVTVRYRISDTQMSSLRNLQRYMSFCIYEKSSYYSHFYRIKDMEILKYLCRYSPYLDKIIPENEEYFPFIIAHYSMLRNEDVGSYLFLEKLMTDPELRKVYEEKFGFGIKEFRDLYGNTKIYATVCTSYIDRIKKFLCYPQFYIKRFVVRKFYGNKYSL